MHDAAQQRTEMRLIAENAIAHEADVDDKAEGTATTTKTRVETKLLCVKGFRASTTEIKLIRHTSPILVRLAVRYKYLLQ